MKGRGVVAVGRPGREVRDGTRGEAKVASIGG